MIFHNSIDVVLSKTSSGDLLFSSLEMIASTHMQEMYQFRAILKQFVCMISLVFIHILIVYLYFIKKKYK